MKKPMITVVSRNDAGWHVGEIGRAAKSRGVGFEFVNLDAKEPISEQLAKTGDVILWRASSLDHTSERPSVMPYIGDKVMVNDTLFVYPTAAYKFFQQSMLEGSPMCKKHSIPTYRAKTFELLRSLVDSGRLTYPFIAKPNKGSQGKGVELISDKTMLESLVEKITLSDYIFQNFIKNDGDWRVIVMGGRPLGAMKRVASGGSHLNNISQGATAHLEQDQSVCSVIYDIAIKAASVFGLRFCGVDIIRDQSTGRFHILEINTAPQWDGDYGFQSMTGVDVANEFVDYALAMLDRKQGGSSLDLVEDHYKKYIGYNLSAEFHFASRLWLWSRDEWARGILDDRLDYYIGTTPERIGETIKNMIDRAANNAVSVNETKKYRRKYFERYPKLSLYNALLFKVVFCDSIYNIDIRPYVNKYVSDKDFLDTFNQLIDDHDAIRVLSTHAVNYFYLLKNYFKSKVSLSSAVLVDPWELLDISRDYDGLVERGELKDFEALKLRIYMLTHAILGESRFYQNSVLHRGFREIVKELEDLIYGHYHEITLDNKCEFLVCAKICNFRSKLRPIIMGEAGNSFSWAGNFIIDTHNNRGGAAAHSLRTAEHRNVLYLMAGRDFASAKSKNIKDRKNDVPKITLGRLARIGLPEIGIRRVIARVDTGATSSSIYCSDIREEDGKLKFKIAEPTHLLWTGRDHEAPSFKKTMVKNTASGTQVRYAIPLLVKMGECEKTVYFSLANRNTMLYSVLLGRNFIHKNFMVDVDRQFPIRSTK